MGYLGIDKIEDVLSKINTNYVDLSSYNKFIDPSVWAILYSEYLRKKSIRENMTIKPPKNNSNSINYFNKIIGKITSNSTVPLERFNSKNRDDSEVYAQKIIELMEISDRNVEGFLRYIISELITNAIDHSDSIVDTVCFGQLFPNIGECELGVIDKGAGFLNTLKKRYGELKTDNDAIQEALKKGVSGYTKNRTYHKNAGYGLYAIHRIIREFGGQLKIISKRGDFCLHYNHSTDKESKHVSVLDEKQKWWGSIVIVRLSLNKIPCTNIEKILKTIRKEDKPEQEKDNLF